MNKTTATEVKEVLERYIEEIKSEFKDDSKNLSKIEILEEMAARLINCCMLQDLAREGVENNSKENLKALLKGMVRVLEEEE